MNIASLCKLHVLQVAGQGNVYFQRFTCSFRISSLFCPKVRLLEKFRERFCVSLFSLGYSRKQFCFKIQNVSVTKMLLRLTNSQKYYEKGNTFHIGANKWLLIEGKKYSQPLCKGYSYVCELFSLPAMRLRYVSFRNFLCLFHYL